MRVDHSVLVGVVAVGACVCAPRRCTDFTRMHAVTARATPHAVHADCADGVQHFIQLGSHCDTFQMSPSGARPSPSLTLRLPGSEHLMHGAPDWPCMPQPSSRSAA